MFVQVDEYLEMFVREEESQGEGSIALAIRAIRAIEIKIRAVNPSPQEIRKLSYLSDSEGYERFP